jgi:hypothetical protein
VRALLAAIGFEGDFSVEELPPGRAPYLVAHIRTPSGMREISGEQAATTGAAIQ